MREPAGATVVERGSYTSEPYSFTHDDCGYDVDVEGTVQRHVPHPGGQGQDGHGLLRSSTTTAFTETQTNPANGKFVTITANASFHEIRAKRVEGTVFEFWAVEAGQFRMYDSDGRLVARDRGSVQFHILFDTEGDDVPGGVQIEEFASRGARSAPGVRRLLRAHHAADRLLSPRSRRARDTAGAMDGAGGVRPESPDG